MRPPTETTNNSNAARPRYLSTIEHAWHYRILITGCVLLTFSWITLLASAGPRILTGDNHTGYDIRYLWCLSSIAAPIAFAGLLSGHTRDRRPAILLAILAISLAAAVFWLDRSNLIVQYQTWINRGMPIAP